YPPGPPLRDLVSPARHRRDVSTWARPQRCSQTVSDSTLLTCSGGPRSLREILKRAHRAGRAHAPPALSALSGLRDRAAGRQDLLLGGRRDAVHGDLELDVDLTVAEHLHGLALADRTLRDQVLDGDGATLGEQRGQLVQVHDLVRGTEGVLEPAEHREAHVQRHLPTLEAGGNLVTSRRTLGSTTRRLTLRGLTATPTGLRGLGTGGRTEELDLPRRVRRHDRSTARGLPATHTGLRGPGTGGRTEVVDLQRLVLRHDHSTSSPVTRCPTVLTMPRISARSSFTAVSPIRLRPSVRSVSRWFCLPPMADLVWVTFRRAITHQPSLPTRHDRRPGRAGARPGPRPPAGAHGERPQRPAPRGPAGPRPWRARC